MEALSLRPALSSLIQHKSNLLCHSSRQHFMVLSAGKGPRLHDGCREWWSSSDPGCECSGKRVSITLFGL